MVQEKQMLCTILIAEDDPDDRLMLQECFDELGIEVPLYFVEDGEELMSYLRQEGEYSKVTLPDVIIMDLNMPRKNGHEALADIKRDKRLRDIPIFVLSTSKDKEDKVKALEKGIHSFLTKPDKYEDLIETIQIFKTWVETNQL